MTRSSMRLKNVEPQPQETEEPEEEEHPEEQVDEEEEEESVDIETTEHDDGDYKKELEYWSCVCLTLDDWIQLNEKYKVSKKV